MNEQHSARPTEEEVEPKVIAAKIAQELREHPEHWMRMPGAYVSGRSEDGCPVGANSSKACVWCVEGLIQKHVEGFYPSKVMHAFAAVCGVKQLYSWNDEPGRTVNDVIELCDKVVAS